MSTEQRRRRRHFTLESGQRRPAAEYIQGIQANKVERRPDDMSQEEKDLTATAEMPPHDQEEAVGEAGAVEAGQPPAAEEAVGEAGVAEAGPQPVAEERPLIPQFPVISQEDVARSNQEVIDEIRHSTEMAERVLRALIAEKQNGNIPGVYGRLGEFGEIDRKYDAAISTSCDLLDSIVVDTVQTGVACLNFLEEHNIGRGTMIPLDAPLLSDEDEPQPPFPENLVRLYDQVTCENEMFKRAYYIALGNTLVADSVEQATRIALGETPFRVVTLTGDLLADGGNIIYYGESARRAGRMRIKPSAPESGEVAAAAAGPAD